jgi:quercetin dioxygenase-like cupin family protein
MVHRMTEPADRKPRRVVTITDPQQGAVIASDSTPPCYVSPQGIRRFEVWSTETMPVAIDEGSDPDSRMHTLTPAPNGTAFKIVEFPPEVRRASTPDEFLKASSALVAGKHPDMHRTNTVDYCIVLDGEITLILDASETVVRKGDVVIQRGTSHAWSNHSDATCRIAFIMVDGRRAVETRNGSVDVDKHT